VCCCTGCWSPTTPAFTLVAVTWSHQSAASGSVAVLCSTRASLRCWSHLTLLGGGCTGCRCVGVVGGSGESEPRKWPVLLYRLRLLAPPRPHTVAVTWSHRVRRRVVWRRCYARQGRRFAMLVPHLTLLEWWVYRGRCEVGVVGGSRVRYRRGSRSVAWPGCGIFQLLRPHPRRTVTWSECSVRVAVVMLKQGVVCDVGPT
jgi:hypothetical protein